MTRFSRLVLGIGLLLASISPAIAQSNGKLYSFANPLSFPLGFADHTWVTDYQARPTCPQPATDYWYSTGDCHPSGSDKDPRLLSSADADLSIARCIARPNESTFTPGPATARIWYGFDGVCHQIANRILAATGLRGHSPITVAGAHGYKISRFVYGEYGTPSQWATLRAECKVAGVVNLSAQVDVAAMTAQVGLEGKTSVVQKEQRLLHTQIAQIRRDATVGKVASRETANEINKAINASLRRLESSLGAEDFKRLFDWPAGQEIVLVNPDVSAKLRYDKR